MNKREFERKIKVALKKHEWADVELSTGDTIFANGYENTEYAVDLVWLLCNKERIALIDFINITRLNY